MYLYIRTPILLYLPIGAAVILASPLALELLVALRPSEILLEIGPGELEALDRAAIGDSAQSAYRAQDLFAEEYMSAHFYT